MKYVPKYFGVFLCFLVLLEYYTIIFCLSLRDYCYNTFSYS